MNVQLQKLILSILSILLLSFVLAACGPADDQAGEPAEIGEAELPETGIETDLTPLVPEEGLEEVEETPVVEEEGEEAPVTEEMTPTVAMTATAEVEETPTVEVEETPTTEVEETPTTEAEETPTVQAAEEEEDVAGEEDGETVSEEGAVMAEEMAIIGASDLIGLQITTADGEPVSEIAEVLFDSEGQIQFVVFDASEFVGTDDRLVAIEWDRFSVEEMAAAGGEIAESGEITPTGEMTGTGEITGTAGQETGEEVAGAEEGEETTAMQQEGIDALIFTGAAADLETVTEFDSAFLEDETLVMETTDMDLMAEFDQMLRMSQFQNFAVTDYQLVDEQSEIVGQIEELLVDLDQGQVLYAVADVGGFVGLGQKSVAIPWDRFEVRTEEQVLVVSVDQTMLESAPEFDIAGLDEFATDNGLVAEDWDDDIEAFWQETGAY